MRKAFLGTMICALLCACGKNTADISGSESICVLHKTALITDSIPNHELYSIEFQPEYYRAMKEQFPNSSMIILGIPDPKIKKIRFQYCPDCRRAHAQYSREQNAKSQPPPIEME